MQEMTGEMHFAWGFGVKYFEINILYKLEYVLEKVHTEFFLRNLIFFMCYTPKL